MSTRNGLNGAAHTATVRDQSLAEIRARRPKPRPVAPSEASIRASLLYTLAKKDSARQARIAAERAQVQGIMRRVAEQEQAALLIRPGKRARCAGINVERSRPSRAVSPLESPKT